MLTQLSLTLFLALLPVINLPDHLAAAKLVGTWQAVATVAEDGKLTEVSADQRTYTFVITKTTMSLYWSGAVIWEAVYRVDVSKTPPVVHQFVTRAPCFCGATPELDETYSLHGNRLTMGGWVLERKRP
jgi:hypothetical protein